MSKSGGTFKEESADENESECIVFRGGDTFRFELRLLVGPYIEEKEIILILSVFFASNEVLTRTRFKEETHED